MQMKVKKKKNIKKFPSQSSEKYKRPLAFNGSATPIPFLAWLQVPFGQNSQHPPCSTLHAASLACYTQLAHEASKQAHAWRSDLMFGRRTTPINVLNFQHKRRKEGRNEVARKTFLSATQVAPPTGRLSMPRQVTTFLF
ncbi:hypothetical protein TRVL_00780 [Trypanosoma vivax]|uniref:Uncharacterized protein n=1 Tax=Trypanosoma vivax (strain Y486) TaxID=1055687 RepID=G0U115_TRYVY|nr:hypothetical protein TRVL_00780 [Trypanosoma vivax]CCC49770.1 hypothetical protein, unlikely [Trypanosoma vivax Y486]